MRLLVVAFSLLAFTAAADAKVHHDKRPAKHATHGKKPKRTARARERVVIHGPIRGQSVGAPWAGILHDAASLPDGDGYVIRRPWRRFGTRTSVDYIERVVGDVREQFPDQHILAIGDISAEHGGQITEHHSHQSGRDVDIGLFYKEKPAAYPQSFVVATADNLDREATYALLAGFVATANEPGGAQVIFLDYDVQRLLYDWAKEHDDDEDTLDKTFQYPHGRGSSNGIVHHEPNHDNHMHVRFKCPNADSACR
jgi:murein endopeptidase